MTKLFNFQQQQDTGKVINLSHKEISLDDLSNSREIYSATGQPLRNKPVQSWELIDEIMNIVKNNKIEAVLEPILVQRTGSNQSFNADERKEYTRGAESPLSTWVFNKLITRIILPEMDNETYGVNPAIGIAYNDLGIQVAFGLNVRTCANMAILGGIDCLINTFSTGHGWQIAYSDLIENLIEWIGGIEENYNADIETINRLHSNYISGTDQMHELIGNLYMLACNKNESSQPGYANAPFGKNLLSWFVEGLRSDELWSKSHDKMNLWKLYNIGTSVMKAENSVDLRDIFTDNSLWCQFLLENYCSNGSTSITPGKTAVSSPETLPVEESAKEDHIDIP